MNITAYKIARAASIEALETKVNEHLSQGWQPYGQLVSTGNAASGSYAQPMVKFSAVRQSPTA